MTNSDSTLADEDPKAVETEGETSTGAETVVIEQGKYKYWTCINCNERNYFNLDDEIDWSCSYCDHDASLTIDE